MVLLGSGHGYGNLEAAILGSYWALSNLVFRGPKAHSDITTSMRMTVRVWEQMSGKIGGSGIISLYTPLWGNPKLHHLLTVPDPALWARYEIKVVQQVMSQGRIISYDTLRDTFQIPSKMFFRYLQLRHAIQAQFPEGVTVQSHGVEKLLISKNVDRTLPSLYFAIAGVGSDKGGRLYIKWRGDIPDLAEDDWEEGIQQYIPLMISARDRYIQLKFLPRAYYTPQKLSNIYPTQSDRCPKCKTELGTFMHVVWSCPVIQHFWSQVVDNINTVSQLQIGMNPIILLLGICDNITPNTHKRLFVFYASFYARKSILLKWKQPDPPTVSQWRALVNSTLPLYKLTYMNRKCPKKFAKIWGEWTK